MPPYTFPDCIVVLCATPLNSSGQFDEISSDGSYIGGQVRMDAAAALFAQQPHTMFVLVGGGIEQVDPVEKWAKVRDMQSFLLAKGVPSQDIALIISQPDTLGNLRAINIFQDFMKPYKTVGILTNDYHLPRTMQMAADAQFDWNVTLAPIAAESVLGVEGQAGKQYPAPFALCVNGEANGPKDWQHGTYREQFTPRAEWLGDMCQPAKIVEPARIY